MITLFQFIIALFERIPIWLISTIARISVGTIFLKSGLTKIDGWANGNTLYLFANEYKLPLIPPEIAAYMATAAELTLPFFLFAGLLTRFAAFALLIMTLVIQIFVYPNAFDTHGVWAVCFLFLMRYGAGPLSLDTIVARLWSPSPANKPIGA
jgi:putative oxidoreductase